MSLPVSAILVPAASGCSALRDPTSGGGLR